MKTAINKIENFPDWIIEKWQNIANILAETIGIPAALIMKTENEFMEVFISSQSENNPYAVGEKEKWYGLYCETVIQTQSKLLVTDATKDKNWDKNPDIKLGMIAYLGFPINFPDNQPFGTICVLDNKERFFTLNHEKLILQFKNVIELDLALLQSFELKTSHLAENVVQEITERKKSETALRESEEKFRKITETIPLAVYYSTGIEGICNYVNPMFVELFGYTLLDIPTIEKWWPLAYPDENYRKQVSEEWTKRVQIALEKQSSIEPLETVVTCKDGSKKNIEWGYITLGEKNYAYGMDITARILAEEASKESEEKFRMISENFVGGVSLFEDNKVKYVSGGYLKILGYERHEVENITFDAIFSFIHEDDVEHIRKTIENAYLVKSKQVQYNFRIKNKQGDFIWMEDVVNLEYDDAGNHLRSIIHSRNITSHKQAEEKLKESELRYRNLFDQANEGLILLTMEGKIAELNKSFAEMHGYTIDEMRNMDIKDLDVLRENAFDGRAAVMQRIYDGEVVRFEVEHYHKKGHSFFLSDTVSLITIAGKQYFLAFHQDITERKQVEEDLRKAKEKAEESDRLKSAFLANMSHEIRTPMNGIIGFSNLLKEPGLTGEEQQEYIKIIEKSGVRMLNIISEIIDISKIESGLVSIHLQEENINDKLESIYTLLKPDADNKKLYLSFTISLTYGEAFIVTDKEKLYSILTNLVKNAIKYTDKGSIDFGYAKMGENLEFFVRDTGIGIKKERQDAIFERFIQADIVDIEARQGAGLGLSIAKAYVELLGGKIWVKSEEGVGSTFYFTLPYNCKSKNIERIEKSAQAEDTLNQIKKLKILIVEDDEISELLLELSVKMFGKEILVAKNGIEAVELCRNSPGLDLILMDIRMPDMNGYEATRQIRQFNKDVIIFAQTAYGLLGDNKMSVEAGCNEYISKPIDEANLRGLIKKYFGKN